MYTCTYDHYDLFYLTLLRVPFAVNEKNGL